MVCQISLGGAANQSCRNVHMMCLFGRMMCTARKLGWRLRHSIVRMRAAKSCAVEVSPQQSAVLKTLRILKLRLIGAAASASATADVRYINCIWVEVAAESRHGVGDAADGDAISATPSRNFRPCGSGLRRSEICTVHHVK